MPASGATSAQTARERSACAGANPSPCPLTVTNPKLRTEAGRARLALDDQHAQPASRGRQRVREPDDSRTYDDEIDLRHGGNDSLG